MNSSHFPPKTRPLIGRTAASANQRPGFWLEMAGIFTMLEFISQSQIKGNYNFSICTVFKFEFFWHKLRVVVSKGFDACIRGSRKKTGFNISWKYIHEILLPDFFSVKRNSRISFILLLVIIFNEMLVVLCEMKFNLSTQWNNRCRF